MSHIVNSCPLTKFDGGLLCLHEADEADNIWLLAHDNNNNVGNTIVPGSGLCADCEGICFFSVLLHPQAWLPACFPNVRADDDRKKEEEHVAVSLNICGYHS